MKKFGFLNLEEHPRGNYILLKLVEYGFYPEVVIEEQSSLAKKNRETLIEDFKKSSKKNIFCPSLEEFKKEKKCKFFKVKNHNDKNCLKIVKSFDLDFLLLGDTRIIKKNIFSQPQSGTINLHPGFLPDVKGNSPYIWSILFDLPQGCSSHFIDDNIDTGPLIERIELNMEKVCSYQKLLEEIHRLCGILAINLVKQFEKNKIKSTNQEQIFSKNVTNKTILKNVELPVFKFASKELKTLARNKLEKKHKL